MLKMSVRMRLKKANDHLKNGKLTLRFLIDAYDAFLRHPSKSRAAKILGFRSNDSLRLLFKEHAPLRLVKELADERREQNNTLEKYILGNMSEEARAIWDDIKLTIEEDMPRTPSVMRHAGLKLKKEIFLQAMVTGSYNLSKACAVAGVAMEEYQQWNKKDHEFKKLVNEIHQHKKDFFESKLVDLCDAGHPSAIIFVNRTLNADRGYTERLQIEDGRESAGGFNLAELDLDIETRKKILEAVRKLRASQQSSKVVDITSPMNGVKQLAERNGHDEKVVDVEEVA